MKITDAMCKAAIKARSHDRIQGFHYPPNFVIRDVYLDHGKQEIWRQPDTIDKMEFYERCEVERMRLLLAAAMEQT